MSLMNVVNPVVQGVNAVSPVPVNIETPSTKTPMTYDPQSAPMLLPPQDTTAQMWGIDTGIPGYLPPQLKPGHGAVASAMEPIIQGQPISVALASKLAEMNARDQANFNASLAGARTRQLMESQNNPDTYKTAQSLIASGVPAGKVLPLAMSQQLSANGQYLGLGASLPAAQSAVDGLNDQNRAMSVIFGVPFEAAQSGGSFNIQSPGVRSIQPHSDGTTSVNIAGQGTVNGSTGTAVGMAVSGNPQGWVNSTLQSSLGGGAGYSRAMNRMQSSQRQPTDKSVSDAASQAIYRFDNNKTKKPTTPGQNGAVTTAYGL